MSKMFAVSKRIFSQFLHDKRTFALLFAAPVVVLWLLSMILTSDLHQPRFAVIDIPDTFRTELEEQDAELLACTNEEAENLLKNNEVDALLAMEENTTLRVKVEGADSSRTSTSIAVLTAALSEFQKEAADNMSKDATDKQNETETTLEKTQRQYSDNTREIEKALVVIPAPYRTEISDALQIQKNFPGFDEVAKELEKLSFTTSDYLTIQTMEVAYLHGDKNWKMLDYYGPMLIGIFLFVYTFITSGMSLVNERVTGTMSRFLATPINSIQVIGGYSLGFGGLALIQTTVILLISLFILSFPNEGNVALVIFTGVSLALASVTLGLLVSGLASNAFQVIQLMLFFVVPQILLCGLFDLSSSPEWLQLLSRCMPLTYGVDTLRDLMLRGYTPAEIGTNAAILWGYILGFFVLASVGYRKKSLTRKINRP